MKIKHIFLFLSMIMMGSKVEVNAQGVGSWTLYSSFNGVQQIVDTKDMLFYLSSGQLYSYDKANDETYNYSTSGRLSDTNISKIFFDYEKNNLVLVYSNANIDLIDRNGKVLNLPDIKDAELNVVPKINDVVFSGDKIYIATNFGCVIYNVLKGEVISAGDYGLNIVSCAIHGDLLLLFSEDGKTFFIGKDDNIASSGRFNKGVDFYTKQFVNLADGLFVSILSNGLAIHVMSVSPDHGLTEGDFQYKNIKETKIQLAPLQLLADGSLMTHTPDAIYIIDPSGNIQEKSLVGSPLQAKKYGSVYEEKYLGAFDGYKKIWVGGPDGIGCYSLENSTITELSAPYKPYGLTLSNIGRLSTSPSGKIYVSNYGWGRAKTIYVNDENSLYYINVIDTDGKIKDITPTEVTRKNKNNTAFKTPPLGFRSGAHVMEDPDDPDAYYIGSGWDGLYRIKDRKDTHHYYEDNSTMRSMINGYSLRVYGFDFDKSGNLWVSQFALTDIPIIHMLPKDKRFKEDTTEDDWSVLNICDDDTSIETQVLACKNSDVVMVKDSYYNGHITFVKTKGTTSTADDEVLYVKEFIDQDGKNVEFNYFTHLVEDMKGRVWVGTDNGVFEITDPAAAVGNSVRVNHLKVPRNDGTNFADYLLNGEFIYWIAVDPANRKWVATQNSGIYLVSADGNEIIEHFDVTNSPLSSNFVTSVTCATDNTVYIGTPYGLYSYKSDASPAKDDFSEVYAYPNPVRPDYSGWITVTGLMDNSLVKIADAAGNVFFQGTSEGGMITWDGCDRSGNRVKTGVYYVFASSGDNGESSKGVVTKILVVN